MIYLRDMILFMILFKVCLFVNYLISINNIISIIIIWRVFRMLDDVLWEMFLDLSCLG